MAKKIPEAIKSQFPKGHRVQLHPGTDAWMMGDRYGEIRGYVNSANDGALIRVKLDKSRKVKEFHPRNLAEVFKNNPRQRNPVENRHTALKAISVKKSAGGYMIARDSDNNQARVAYDFGLDGYENAVLAAEKLAEKMGWGGDLVGGHLKGAYVFTMRESTFRGLPRKNPSPRASVPAGTATLGKWTVVIGKRDADYGYFEHNETGEGGGLWLKNGVLVDQDGTSVLPLAVARLLRDHFGVKVDSSYVNDSDAWEKETPGSGEWRNNPRKRRKGRERKKNPANDYVIALYQGKKRFTFDANKNRFTDNSPPALYTSQIAAEQRAQSLLMLHTTLRQYRVTVERAKGSEAGAVFGARPRQRNPGKRGKVWEIYNPKTGETLGREFDKRGDALGFIKQLQSNTVTRLHWKARPKT